MPINSHKRAACLTAIGLVLLLAQGCLKDYSFEGAPPADTTSNPPPADLPPPTSTLPYCPICKQFNAETADSWSFEWDSAKFCGHVTGALMNFEKTAFTFFGPSACSTDSGLVMTVYFDNTVFDSNKSNVSTEKIVFQYYDKVAPSYMLSSKPIPGFNFTIDQYYSQSGDATGHFSGNVYTAKDVPVYIKNGKFRVKFK